MRQIEAKTILGMEIHCRRLSRGSSRATGRFTSVETRCDDAPMHVATASGRPSTKCEGRSERREGKEASAAAATNDEHSLNSELRRCSCNCRRIIVATSRRHPCRRSAVRCGVNSRALRKGRSPGAYYSIAPPSPPLPSLLLLASLILTASNYHLH